ncbi:unnamed protein product [Haemonchus placei]|uniref:Sushi domain-containing protein n=1 Tax=Haemonchus placei TaxID=6290 RepID=A0A0N4WGF8_HAEPC|nr:unnamed protein product [Haemonchus placei]
MQKVAILVVLVGVASGINCPPLTVLDGAVIYSLPLMEGGYPDGTTAQVMCNVGFHLEGISITLCKDGNWQLALGVCKANTEASTTRGGFCSFLKAAVAFHVLPTQCPPIIAAGGTATYDTNDRNGTDEWLKPDGSMVSITCDRGFELDGESHSTCMNGVWTPPIGFCKLKICTNSSPVFSDCPSMPSPAGASLTYSNHSASAMTFPTGTLVVMDCNPGSVEGPAAASCSNGTWIPPTLGTCSPIAMNVTEKCPALVVPSGMVDYSDPDILKVSAHSNISYLIQRLLNLSLCIRCVH